MTQAPICHIPPIVPTNQPGPVDLPAIPPAGATLQSLQATVNAMRQVVMLISGQGAQGPPGRAGKDANAKGSWREVSRVTSRVKVYQNNDPSTGNFVEVEQINRLVMGNKDTGQTWTWSR